MLSLGAISSMKNQALRQAMEIAVMREGLDAQKAEGEAAVKLIEAAGQVSRAAATSLSSSSGQYVDRYI